MTAKEGAKTKVRASCGKRKPLKSFQRNATRADGLQSSCKPCKNEREAGRRAAARVA